MFRLDQEARDFYKYFEELYGKSEESAEEQCELYEVGLLDCVLFGEYSWQEVSIQIESLYNEQQNSFEDVASSLFRSTEVIYRGCEESEKEFRNQERRL